MPFTRRRKRQSAEFFYGRHAINSAALRRLTLMLIDRCASYVAFSAARYRLRKLLSRFICSDSRITPRRIFDDYHYYELCATLGPGLPRHNARFHKKFSLVLIASFKNAYGFIIDADHQKQKASRNSFAADEEANTRAQSHRHISTVAALIAATIMPRDSVVSNVVINT